MYENRLVDAKVLLISFQEDLDVVGLKSLHLNLLRNSYESYLLHLPKYNSRNAEQSGSIKKFISDLRPALIGISLMSIDFQKAADLTSFIKEVLPGIPIMWGGTHPTVSPEMSLRYADFVCIGEGEKVIIECMDRLSQRKPIEDVGNLAYMKNGVVLKNDLYPLIDNLDEMFLFERNPPARYIEIKNSIIQVDNAVYKRNSRNNGITYNTMSSKGCPFSCTYCCNNFFNRLYKSKRVRRRSVAVVIEEIERAIRGDSTIKYINFLDDCFLACSREYLNEFCESYREKIDKPFIIRAIPTYIDNEKIIKLKQAGLRWVNLGLESGSDRTNKDIYKRGSSREDFLAAARIISENRLASFYDIMLDNPFETLEDQIWTIKTIAEAPRPFYPMLYSLTFFYGSEIYERALKECPERIDDPLYKNIFGYRKSSINALTRMAAFLSEKKVKELVGRYKNDEKGIGFKSVMLYYHLLSALLFEPVAYFRVVRLANNDSIPATVNELRYYFKSGIKKYLSQFFGPKIYSKFRK